MDVLDDQPSLASITSRLERRGASASLTSIDLRGKGRRTAGRRSDDTPSDRGDDDDAIVPRPTIRRFVAALAGFGNVGWGAGGGPPPSVSTARSSCQVTYLALHNHLLDRCELPLLFDALPHMPSLETLVLFHHDLGDEGVELLMHAFKGGNDGDCDNDNSCACDDVAQDVVAVSKSKDSPHGLRELYLSHCNISCKGASVIANALTQYSGLKHLQVISLGSNAIREKGASLIARAFGGHPLLQRLVLLGNKGALSLGSETIPFPLSSHALDPIGWQGVASTVQSEIFAPLIQPHIQRRWDKDRVLVRPYDLLRQRLREEMYKEHSTYIDSNFHAIPDLVSWMGRDWKHCFRRTTLHSQSFAVNGQEKCHESSGRCSACAMIHLNDVYELFQRMPHLFEWFRGISNSISCDRDMHRMNNPSLSFKARHDGYL